MAEEKKEVAEEIGDLLSNGPSEPEEGEAQPKVEGEEVQPQVEEEPEQEEGEGEEEPEPEPEAEEKTEPEPEEDGRDTLLRQIEELSSRLTGGQEVQAKPEVETPEMLRFMEEADYEKVIGSSEGFNALLNKVYNSAVERTMRDVPRLVSQVAAHQIGLARRVDDFWRGNEDLVPHKGFVVYVSNELQSQHSDWDYDKLFDETSKEVRKRLNLGVISSKPPVVPRARKPVFAKSPGGSARGKGEQLSEVEKDIMDLIS